MQRNWILGLLFMVSVDAFAEQQDLTAMQVHQQKIALGKLIFHDNNLSEPAGQSCGSCHQTENAFSSPGNVVTPGANPNLFGNRNAPSIAYVKYNPVLHWDFEEKHWVGGFFYDGRETNLQSQADKPMTNPLEMGNRSNKEVVAKVKVAPYAAMFKQLYGEQVFKDTDTAMDAVIDALVSYEHGPEFAKFSSKYDWYLSGKIKLTKLEQLGLEVFEAEDKGNCAACHISQVDASGRPPLFTDYTYDNLGLSKPRSLPFFDMAKHHNPSGAKYVDHGLSLNPNIHDNQEQIGKFKVPTLRNIAITGPYMHNGIFTELKEVVEFYNTRDIDDKWGKPEVLATVNEDELGDLKLTELEVEALVAFMKTLTDGYEPTTMELSSAKTSSQKASH